MTAYAALLRGVNIGSRRRVPMGDFRDALTSLGYAEVETYLQSGNAVFTTRKAAATVGSEIEQELQGRLGLDVAVVVRSAAELATVVDQNPFPEAADAPTKVHVAFLSAKPPKARMETIDADLYAPDELRLGDGVVYLRYPGGAGRSKLTNDLLERRLGVTATSRNWNTVTALLERSSARERG